MRRRAALAATAALIASAGRARAQPAPPPEVAAELPGARLLGQGRLTFLGLHVYDIRLWVRDGFSPAQWAAHPLALEIEYARTLYGRLIAERSLAEMRRQRPIDEPLGERWVERMKQVFPDVARGDRITGVYRPEGLARFFHNAAPRGELRDGDFAPLFFGIWLSDRTSEPKLRERLLGVAP